MSDYVKDLVERTIATYALTFLGLVGAAGFDLTDLTAVKAASLAAVPAALQVVYGWLAKFVGSPDSAGLTK